MTQNTRGKSNPGTFFNSLYFKLFIAFLIIALFPLTIVVHLNIRSTASALTHASYHSLLAAANQTATIFDAFINENLERINTKTQLPFLAEYLILPDENRSSDPLRKQVMGVLRAFTEKDRVFISSCALLDQAGVNILDTHSAGIGADDSKREYFQQAMETGRPYVSSLESFGVEKTAVIYFSGPVIEPSGKPLGVLRVRYNAAAFQQLIIQNIDLAGERSFAIVLNAKGQLVANGSMSHIETAQSVLKPYPLPKGSRNPLLSFASEDSTVADLNAEKHGLGGDMQFFTTVITSYSENLLAAASARLKNKTWSVIFLQPFEVFMSPVEAQADRAFRLALVFAMLAALMSFIMARLLARPIKRLTVMAGQIAKGDMDVRVAIRSKDEIGILSRSFMKMRDSIKQNIQSLTIENEERRRAEEELRHLRNYLENIIDSMPSMLIGVDTDCKVTQWNSEAQRTTGLSMEEALGRPLDKVIPHLSTEMDRLRLAMETKQEQTDPKRAHHVDGETRYEDVTVYPLIANGVEGAVIRIDDVTEQVRLEEMMIQSEKMLSVGGLAAGMAHEINNPLSGMMQSASLMSDRLSNLDLPANIQAADEAGTSMETIHAFMEARKILGLLDRIRISGRRAAEIVSNMLSFARKSDSSSSARDMAELIDLCVDLAGSDYDLKKKFDFRQIDIVRDYEEDLPFVPCEAGKIQQVILNILRNGSEAMQEKAEKDAAAGLKGNKPCFILRLAHEREAGRVRIEIEDNGPGMDEAIRKRVFEPFFTTKPTDQGTGLGLSVSYFIITENHGGAMTVESSPGGGSRFIISLPVDRKGS